jgi:hypothetical protein
MKALLLIALFQSTAPVGSFTAPNMPKAQQAKPDANGVVCRKESIVGSRMKTKVCYRPGDVQQRAVSDRDMVEKSQVLQTILDPGAGPPR